jgi:hypothetical protein
MTQTSQLSTTAIKPAHAIKVAVSNERVNSFFENFHSPQEFQNMPIKEIGRCLECDSLFGVDVSHTDRIYTRNSNGHFKNTLTNAQKFIVGH